MDTKTIACCALLLLPVLAAANGPESAEPAYTDSIGIEQHRFRVDIAADDASRSYGLMFRTAMPEDAGMLFVFEQAQPLSFWMRNTRIPLDIIYFDRDAQLLSIQANAPPCRTARCSTYPSVGEAKFVVELNGGKAAELGLKRGDRLCSPDGSIVALPRCD